MTPRWEFPDGEEPRLVEQAAAEGPVKARYRVPGQQRALGHEPGSLFTAELDPRQAARLIRRGSLAREDPEGSVPHGLTRPELDRLAADAGVENPERLANKQAVIDAIDTA